MAPAPTLPPNGEGRRRDRRPDLTPAAPRVPRVDTALGHPPGVEGLLELLLREESVVHGEEAGGRSAGGIDLGIDVLDVVRHRLRGDAQRGD